MNLPFCLEIAILCILFLKKYLKVAHQGFGMDFRKTAVLNVERPVRSLNRLCCEEQPGEHGKQDSNNMAYEALLLSASLLLQMFML